MSMSNGCQAGCKTFTGYETRHHPHCKFYPESLSKMLDDSQTKIKELETENAESWVDADKYDNQQERIKELEAQLESPARQMQKHYRDLWQKAESKLADLQPYIKHDAYCIDFLSATGECTCGLQEIQEDKS